MRPSFLLVAVIGLGLLACGSEDTQGSGGGAADTGGGGPATGSGGAGTGGGSGGATSQGGGGSGGAVGTGGTGGACAAPMVEYDAKGCLTFQGASAICGFASDGATCALSVMCTTSTDDSQCKINCEMGTTVTCYKADAVKCVVDATCAGDCKALEACKWIL